MLRRVIIPVFFSLLFNSLHLTLNSQSPNYFRRYEVEHGLTNNNVTCSVIDSKGFMWFGTRDGLNRFDGYTFKTFRNDPNDSTTLGNNSIISLSATSSNELLVGTEKGLYKYDPIKNVFSLVPSTDGYFTRSLCGDKKKNIWAIYKQSLFQYNLITGKSHLYPTDKIKAESLCIDSDDNLWVSSGGNLYQHNSKSDSFSRFEINIAENKTAISIGKVFNADNGSLIIGTHNSGILLVEIKSRKSVNILATHPEFNRITIRDFIKYSENEYWIAMASGLLIFNIRENKVTNIKMEYNNKYSISDNTINTLCRDNEGGIWAGTRFGGISYYSYPYNLFRKYSSQAANSIEGNGVHEICPDGQGNLWIGTETAGLSKLNLKSQKFTQYSLKDKDEEFSYPNIHGLLIVDNELWIGTYQYGLFRMNLKTEKITKHYSAGKTSFKTSFIVHLFHTKSGRLFVGTWVGLYEYQKKTDSFVAVPGFNFQTQSMMEDRHGTLWVTTLGNGVFAISEKTGEVKQYRAGSSPDSLQNNMVNGQYEDSRGFLWFATEKGLAKFEPSTGRFKTYTTNQGLPSNFIFKILEDKSNNLWVSSTKGLVRFDPLTETIKIFTVADGILNDQFNWNSAYKDSSGRMYFGSVKGLISFMPENFMINNKPPPVYITGFQVFNHELDINSPASPLTTSIAYANKIKLKHDQSTISIDFAALSYTSPEMNEYSFMMEGLDNRWTKLKTNRKAYFTQLPPGSYTFRVKAANNSGIWNESETRLEIEVLPPFWKTWWAYVIYSALIIGITYLFFRMYNNFIHEKHRRNIELLEHQKEKELYQNKIDFFTSIAHEIRTPLTLIQGPMENIMIHANEVPAISKNLRIMAKNTSRLLEISNQLLDFQKIESQHFKLTLEEVNISRLLREIHTSFEPLMQQRQIPGKLEIYSDTMLAFVDIDSFEKIMNNLYSNAVKYSDSYIKTSLSWLNEQDAFVIEITNDGPVIPNDSHEKIFEPFFRIMETNHQSGTGIGLTISRALTELHNGTLTVKTTSDGLNTFILKLPAHSWAKHIKINGTTFQKSTK